MRTEGPFGEGKVSVRVACVAMRVRFEALLVGDDMVGLQAAGEEALEEILRVEGDLSPYAPTSDLYALNAAPTGRFVPVQATTIAFLERARALVAASSGCFDPSVGPLMACWGLVGEIRGTVPDEAAIAAAREKVGFDRILEIDAGNQRAALVVPGARIDPGAIGKGWALVRARERLSDAGVRVALVHGGTSSVAALGGPWEISVSGFDGPMRVTLDGDALGVSAPSGKRFEVAGRHYGHVMDPRTGRPGEGVDVAWVQADSATDADAFSTALLVGGDAMRELLPPRMRGGIARQKNRPVD